MSKKRSGFRAWFYLRMGYTIYWAFLIMGINTLTVTYYLAIERAPFLKEIFPTFIHYGIILVIIAVPILILTGFIHYRKIPGYRSEAEVGVENNPYTYKLSPGHLKVTLYPLLLAMSKAMIKISNNEKLTDDEMREFEDLNKKMVHLIDGGFVGIEGRVLSFGKSDED